MQNVKGSPFAPVPVKMTDGQIQCHRPLDPAEEAGLPKVSFYDKDKWVIGLDGAKSYVVPKNTAPEPVSHYFLHSAKADPVTDQVRYDQRKFELDEWPHFEFPGGRVAIGLASPRGTFADVTFDGSHFVVTLLEIPKPGERFSFNKDEFLKAVDAAKWRLEMYCMPDSDLG